MSYFVEIASYKKTLLLHKNRKNKYSTVENKNRPVCNTHKLVRLSWSLDSFNGWLKVVIWPGVPVARKIASFRAFKYAGNEWCPLLLYQTTNKGSSFQWDNDQPPYLQNEIESFRQNIKNKILNNTNATFLSMLFDINWGLHAF